MIPRMALAVPFLPSSNRFHGPIWPVGDCSADPVRALTRIVTMIEIKTIELNSDADYQLLMDATNHTWPDFKRTLAETRKYWELHRKDKFRETAIISNQGEPIGVGATCEAYWQADAHRYFVEAYALPGVAYDRLLPLMNHLEQVAAHQGATMFQTEQCDLYPEGYGVWQSLGYESKLDGPVSRLDIQAFDSSGVQSGLSKFQAIGAVIKPLTEMPIEDEGFLRAFYDLRWEINQDIPQVGEPEREPFERFLELYLDPKINKPECCFLAILDGELIGMSNGQPMDAMPDQFDTWTTGTLRAHRRKGVATALKVQVIEWCKANGYRWIITGNEKNNPMYDLNIALGYRKFCSWDMLERAERA